MITNQVLSISPQGQITIPMVWRKSVKVGKNKELLANLKIVNGSAVITLIQKPTSWADFAYGLGKEAWKDIDVDKYIEEERNSWN